MLNNKQILKANVAAHIKLNFEMKKIFLLCLPIIFCLVTNKIFAQTGTEATQIVLITAINTIEKEIIIDADFVQMLTGKAAIKAAKKTGEAEYDINKKKDTIWYVPNDYFVLNSNNTIRQLKLLPTVAIYLVKEGGSVIAKSNIAILKKSFKGRLFRLSIFNNKVIKIVEIYTP